MTTFFIQEEISTSGVLSDSEEAEELVSHWLEMLDDFESFTEDTGGEHHVFNLELIIDVRIAILSGQ